MLTFSPADDTVAPRQTLSVSLEKGALQVVFGTRFLSRISIRGARSYAFEENRHPLPEEVASSLPLAVSELGAYGSDITLVIPKSWVIIKTAEFPSTVGETVADVISYEMDRLTPFTQDEALYDFRVLKDDGKRITLLLMAAKADVVRPYIKSLGEAGLAVSRVSVSLAGIGTLCLYIDRKGDALFLETDDRGFDGGLFEKGTVTQVFSGSFLSADEKERSETISAEIKDLIEASKTQGLVPELIAVLKGQSPGLRESLKLRLNMPVRVMGEKDIAGVQVSSSNISYAAVGCAIESLWPAAKDINLLTKGRREVTKIPVTLTVALLLAIGAALIFYFITPLKIEEKRLQEISSQLVPRKEEAKKVEALQKEVAGLEAEIGSINNFKGEKPLTLNLLKELTLILPKTAWLTRVRATDSTVDIEGYASTATELLPKLEASKYFRKVEFASPTFRDMKMNADRFTIKMEFEGVTRSEGEKQKNEKK
ncbi:MAG: PilN domain-containing protein [Nitrospirae bacterium]|nr:PilN domain-containing protein [Nitrospirota bacterium]